MARSSLQEARAVVRGLRAASLAAELDRAREALEVAGIEVAVRTDRPPPADLDGPLAFIVREGATNVIRHSRARRCEIAVRRTADFTEVEIRDDGVGPSDAAGQGSGLRGLAERVAEIDGTLQAGPAPGGGFRLIARVPFTGSGSATPRSEAAAPA